MKLSELLNKSDLDDDPEVCAIEVDSRRVDAQTWWLAARGVSSHALDYADDQLQYAGVVYEPPYAAARPDWIAVDDLGVKVGEIAARFYAYPSKKLRIFAVTGTDGKSSLVHLIAQALDAAMIGTIGIGRLNALQQASHTTPDALNMQRTLAGFVQQGVDRVAMEVSSHALDQGRIAGVDVDVAIFTNLSRDHLDYHADMEAYFLAKAKLFAQPISHAVINIDDEYGRRLIAEGHIHPQATVWGVSSQGNIHLDVDHMLQAKAVELHQRGISMTLCVDNEEVAIGSRLLARFNVDNLLNVAACLLADGVVVSSLPALLAGLRGVPGRVEAIALPNHTTALVDYAHTPAALENALRGIRAHIKGKLWVIFGCGGDRDTGKRPLMASAAEQFADYVVVTDDNPRSEHPAAIVRDVLAGFIRPENVEVVQPRKAAICHVLNKMQPGDAVLIAGKGHEHYQIIGGVRHDFSDQAVVNEWVAAQ